MEKKPTSTWYRCLFCTRVFPKASQLLEHRRLYHALEWKERKLVKETQFYNSEVKHNYEHEMEHSFHRLPKQLKSVAIESADCRPYRLNSKVKEAAKDTSNKIGTTNCQEEKCNGNCLTVSSRKRPDSLVTSKMPSVSDPTPTYTFEIIKIKKEPEEATDMEIDNSNAAVAPDFFDAAEVDESTSLTTISAENKQRKSARLTSSTNLSIAKMKDCLFRETSSMFYGSMFLPCKTEEGQKESDFKCSLCSKKFQSKANLSSHELTHRKVKPFKCDTCGKSFLYNGNLKIHSMCHTGELPYSCVLCNESFKTKAFLIAHVSVHCKTDEGHKKSDRKFECALCNKRFNAKANLSAHELTHRKVKPFKCDTCGKTFAQKGNLKTHAMIHTGELPYTCMLCNRSFRTKAFLTAHGIVHSDDRNFQCLHCGHRFRTKGILKTHSISFHGIFTQ